MIDQAKLRARRRRCVLAHRQRRASFYKLGLNWDGKPRIRNKQPKQSGLKPVPEPARSTTEVAWQEFRDQLTGPTDPFFPPE